MQKAMIVMKCCREAESNQSTDDIIQDKKIVICGRDWRFDRSHRCAAKCIGSRERVEIRSFSSLRGKMHRLAGTSVVAENKRLTQQQSSDRYSDGYVEQRGSCTDGHDLIKDLLFNHHPPLIAIFFAGCRIKWFINTSTNQMQIRKWCVRLMRLEYTDIREWICFRFALGVLHRQRR
jgi:hypothetical protein